MDYAAGFNEVHANGDNCIDMFLLAGGLVVVVVVGGGGGGGLLIDCRHKYLATFASQEARRTYTHNHIISVCTHIFIFIFITPWPE